MKTIKELYGVEVGEKFDLELPRCNPFSLRVRRETYTNCYINKFGNKLCIYIPDLPGVYELQVLDDYLSAMGAEIITKEDN